MVSVVAQASPAGATTDNGLGTFIVLFLLIGIVSVCINPKVRRTCRRVRTVWTPRLHKLTHPNFGALRLHWHRRHHHPNTR